MKSVSELFQPLVEAVERFNRERKYGTRHSWHHRLTIKSVGQVIDVEYRGEYELWFDESPAVLILNDLCKLFTAPTVAARLRSFTFRTAAGLAANGTYDFDIDPLVNGRTKFPRLSKLVLDQGEGEHGYKILTSPASGEHFSEAGVLARVLSKAPRLSCLVSPVPPNAAFFRGRKHPLQELDVDAGYDHSGFIRQLTRCKRFPHLQRLTFTDYRQTYMTDWREKATSFEDYELFLRSPVAAGLKAIRLREVSLSAEQIKRLRGIRRVGVQITRREA